MAEPQILSTDIDQTKFGIPELSEMRTQFPGQDDETLARFLIARNNNVAKASELLTGHLAWKEANLPILKSSCVNEVNKGKVYVHGTDLEGHPLLIWRARFNIASERDIDEMGRMCIWWLMTAIAALPSDKSKLTILFDRTNFRSENSDFEFMKHMAPIMQNNFPERVYRVIVYPSGFIFYGIWNMAKWFLDPVTQAKVQPMLALSGVQQYISDDFIPEEMGGQCTFKFDGELFPDPYPADVISAAAARAAAAASAASEPAASAGSEEPAAASEA